MALSSKVIYKISLLGIVSLSSMIGCKKQDEYLSAVPSNNLAVPKTLRDLQLIIQDDYTFNYLDPSLGTLSGDEFNPPEDVISHAPLMERNAYTWAKTIFSNQNVVDWSQPYLQVYYANTVLDYLKTIKYSNNDLAMEQNIQGCALFFRAKAYFNLISEFATPYDSITSKTDLGVPIRASSDLNEKIARASVRESYDQIISDLKSAILLLPSKSSVFTLPDNAVASGFLARVYLAMGMYNDAYNNANDFLKVHDKLTDYNTLPVVDGQLSNNYLSEDIFHSTSYYYSVSGSLNSLVDSTIYNSYEINDLRKQKLFYDYGYGPRTFAGWYDIFNYNFYDGIAVDELYLIRAECSARKGDLGGAMGDLNTLLVARYATGTFVPKTATNTQSALKQILFERRKELLFRGTRWTDLRRLNKDPQYATTLTHIAGSVTYTLPPNDPKYVLPIPDNEIQLSGIQQNPR